MARGYDEVERRRSRGGLFDQAPDFSQCSFGRTGGKKAVARCLFHRYFERADQIAADIFIGINHLLHAAGRTHHEFIRQENREGLIPHDFACAPYCMSQAQRLLLPHEGGIARHQPGWGKDGKILAAPRHGMFQLIGNIEMIFDDALSAAGDKAHLLNASSSEEHTSELQSLMRTSYAVSCLTNKQ